MRKKSKKIILSSILLAVFGLGFFIGISNVSAVSQPVNPNANQKTKNVLNYLYSLPGKTENKTISGQAFGADWQYTDNVVALYDQTGIWPGLLAGDYYHAYYDYPICLPKEGVNCEKSFEFISSMNSKFIDHWNKGGLVTISGHMINPKNVTNMWDTDVSLSDIVASGTATHKNWITYLDMIAVGLKELEADGVVVIYRPLHEMHGSWFWWGGKNTEEYKALWKQLYNYFTYTKGINNLLWVYSPAKPASGHFFDYYPGDEYVDIIANDFYTCDPETDIDFIANYQEMKTKTKPLAFGELGPCGVPRTANDPKFDYIRFITAIKSNYPDITYFTAWANYWSIVKNLNGQQFLEDPWVINRGEIDFPSDIEIPSTPSNLTVLAVSSSQINLSWTVSTDNVGVAGYRLERCSGLACTAFSQIATPTDITYNDANLSASTTYRYKIRAVDAAGNLSNYSSIASAATQSSGDVTQKVIQLGDSWNYFKGTLTPNSSWKGLSFTGSWSDAGSTTIGRGSGYTTTLSDTNYTTLYARKNFTLADASGVTNMLLYIGYDDGFVAYINGTEVAKSSTMPAGAPNHSTVANGSHEVVTVEPYDLTAHIGNLQDGNNILAIEIHNKDNILPATGDIGVSPELEITISASPVVYTLSDFKTLLSHWLSNITPGDPTDINDDDIVNTRDLGIMMSNWQN